MFTMIMELIRNLLFLIGYVSGNGAFPKPLSDEEEQDYSLQEGETLHVDVAIKNKRVRMEEIA